MEYAWKASGRQAEARQKSTCPCYFSSFTWLCSTGRAKEHHAWKSHSRELPFLPKAQLLMAYLIHRTLTEQEPHPRITSNAERIMKSRDKTQDIGKIMICPRHGHQVAQKPASSKLSKKLKENSIFPWTSLQQQLWPLAKQLSLVAKIPAPSPLITGLEHSGQET